MSRVSSGQSFCAAIATATTMLSIRTKQINVYGKRSRRIIDAPLTENSISEICAVDSPKPDRRVPLVHRMKTRENSKIVKVKPPSPKIVGLTKQRVVSNGSPIRKKRVIRVAEALGGSKEWEGTDAGTKISSGTLPRVPLSTLTTNAPSIVVKSQKKPATSPKSLMTTRKLSTVQVDIEVLDDKGQTLKQERRVTRTDVIANPTFPKLPKSKTNGLNAAQKSEGLKGNKQASAQKVARAHPEIISIGSSIDDGSQQTLGTQPHPIVLSNGSSASNDTESSIWELRSNRQRRPGVTRIILSDDSASEESEGEDCLPTESPAKPLRKSVASSTKKNTSTLGVIKPSELRVEVLVPPAPYKTHPAPLVASSPTTKPDAHPATLFQYPTTHNLIPCSPSKPRPLTPIRRRQGAPLFAPPSPTTPTDFDLSFDFSHLDIGLAPEELESLRPTLQISYPEYLRPLLAECSQEKCGPYEFSAFIESFPCDPILQNARSRGNSQYLSFKKIGEASYSEVFGIGDVVLKVIPLRNESRIAHDDDEDGPAPTDAKDVRKEIIVTRAMGEVHHGFVKLLKTYIVRGKYPEVLLSLWDQYHSLKGSESVRPDTFMVSQVYAIIVLPNGGPDLEAYTFLSPSKTGWRQACSVFWQVAKSLAHAETLVSFEHRDLHWGQILVKDIPMPKPAPLRTLTHVLNQNQRSQTTSKYMDDLEHGVQATIIDLGLSRMDAGDGDDGNRVQWTPFDEEVFMGEGDYQFDMYRIMRELTMGNWEAFHPLTNVMWLHYLVTKLLRDKNLKPPSLPRKPRPGLGNEDAVSVPTCSSGNAGVISFTEKDCYDCLVDVEDWLGRCVAEFTPPTHKPRSRGRRPKAVASAQIKAATTAGPACAGEVAAYAVKRGWVRPTS